MLELWSFHGAASCHTGHPKEWGRWHGVGLVPPRPGFLVGWEMLTPPPPTPVSFLGRGDSQNCRSRLARN